MKPALATNRFHTDIRMNPFRFEPLASLTCVCLGGVNATDGVHYIMENGYSYFVTDSIAVLKVHPKLKQYLSHDDFIVIKLQLLPDKQAQMIMEDGNGHELYRQTYTYSDAKVNLKLFYTDGVLR
jgi:hypothetical protein